MGLRIEVPIDTKLRRGIRGSIIRLKETLSASSVFPLFGQCFPRPNSEGVVLAYQSGTGSTAPLAPHIRNSTPLPLFKGVYMNFRWFLPLPFNLPLLHIALLYFLLNNPVQQTRDIIMPLFKRKSKVCGRLNSTSHL